MNKEDKLKSKFINFIKNDLKFDYGSYELTNTDIGLIWNWINKNYISKDKLEGLKMDKIFRSRKYMNNHSFSLTLGWNQAVDEINNKIEELLK